ncbi:MAG: effector binding domain-containing protein [Agriterribacter sp.]
MQTIVAPFSIIGIAIRTTNENEQSSIDIPALWNRFLSENIMEQISNKIDHTVYCIYTDYEKDHTKPYTTLLGCKVSSLHEIPKGLTGKLVEGGRYEIFTTHGSLADGIVYNEWLKIWDAGIERIYTSDFEVYDERAQDPTNATVDIFIAVKEPLL